MTPPTHETRIALADALVALSATDLPYGDLYLHRAQEIFEPVFSAEQYRALCGERDALPVLARELRELVARRDWSQARALAQRGARGRQRISENEHLLLLGDAVYAPRLFRADPGGLALAGFDVDSVRPDTVRDACIARLHFALTNDADMADFYRERLTALADLSIRTNGAVTDAQDAATLQRRILEAAEKADFSQAERLSAALISAAAIGTSHEPGHAPARGASLAASLAAPFPHAVIRRAEEIGLTAVTLTADATLSGYLYSDVLDGAALADALAAWSGTDAVIPRGDDRWYTLSVNLRDALDLLRRQPCMSSAGSRYLPMFEAETLLVETFCEREPEPCSDLLKALALPRRRGLSRVTIEDAVRSRGRDVCAALGLEPARHAVIPIPFDAYLRLAPRYNWGTERLWTHFDGYQVNHGRTLRALVGGDAGYGGAADLCSVARDYESERIVTRLCIVHRERLMARGG